MSFHEHAEQLRQELRRNAPWKCDGEALFVRHLQTTKHVDALIRIFEADHRMSAAVLNLLFALADAPNGRSQQELKELMVVSHGTSSDILRKLAGRRPPWAKRKPLPTNAKYAQWFITPAGKEALEAALKDFYPAVDELFSCFSVQQKETFLKLAEQLQASAEKLRFVFQSALYRFARVNAESVKARTVNQHVTKKAAKR